MVVRGTVQDTDCPPRVSTCRIMLMNCQNHSIPSFCSTHLLGGSRQRDYTAQRNSAKDVAKIVMQVDFVENVTTKISCLRKSVYWPYNQLFAQHVFGSMGEHIQL